MARGSRVVLKKPNGNSGGRKRKNRSNDDGGDDEDEEYVLGEGEEVEESESDYESDVNSRDLSDEESFEFSDDDDDDDEDEFKIVRSKKKKQRNMKKSRVSDDEIEDLNLSEPKKKRGGRSRKQESRDSDFELDDEDDDDADFSPDEDDFDEDEVSIVSKRRVRVKNGGKKLRSKVSRTQSRKKRRTASMPARKRQKTMIEGSDDDFVVKDRVSVGRKRSKSKKARKKRSSVDSESLDSDFVISDDDDFVGKDLDAMNNRRKDTYKVKKTVRSKGGRKKRSAKDSETLDSDFVISNGDDDEDDDLLVMDQVMVKKQQRKINKLRKTGRRKKRSVGNSEPSDSHVVISDDDDEDDKLHVKDQVMEDREQSKSNKVKKMAGSKGRRKKRSIEDSDPSDSDFVISEEEEDDDDDDDDDDFFGDKEDKKKVGMKDSLLKSGSTADLSEGESEKPVSRSSGGDNNSYLSNTRFDQCSISSLSLKGVKAAGYERMTLVQEATLPVILKGKDVLAKAKTGTGKTVAFLLPAIEIVSKLPPIDRDQKRPPINVLVICPTRELADQAATEANTLLKFHPSIGVQCVIGGTRLALEQKRMQANPCQILVATPGRLRDHIENTPGLATRLMGVKVLVLDEADRLLDMGFRKDIEKIVAAVPKQRQTLLFSATVPDEVRQICYIAMKRDHEFVNTVEEGSEETHSQVRQMHLIAPLEKQFPVLYSLLTDHIAEDVDYKVIVFCTTAMVTKLVADLLSELRLNVREIHSRKPQSYRTRVSKEFKESKGLILVSSDVSARGVDYPDVTLVVQIGVPADREQYIHRLGRTGRKGKEGQGILLLAPWEEFFLSNIKDLPITKAPVPLVDPDTRMKVERALGHVEMKNKESAYQAWLGYYNSNKMVGRDKSKLVLLANEFSRSMGLDNPPAIAKLVLRKMGLNNVPGLRAK